MVRVLTSQEFEKEVLQSKLPVIVDFFAPWCGPCRMVAPVFDDLAKKWGVSHSFFKVNIDESQDVARALGVSSIPAFFFFDEGKIVGKSLGYKNQAALESLMTQFFSE
ncbi:thioredoxin [Candidatus Dependentiae bacterium]|nr:thioredoxin [Candidatus Dependentiae bacterium]